MNFLSCNRLVQEKETQMNNRYHRVRLDEIKVESILLRNPGTDQRED